MHTSGMVTCLSDLYTFVADKRLRLNLFMGITSRETEMQSCFSASVIFSFS